MLVSEPTHVLVASQACVAALYGLQSDAMPVRPMWSARKSLAEVDEDAAVGCSPALEKCEEWSFAACLSLIVWIRIRSCLRLATRASTADRRFGCSSSEWLLTDHASSSEPSSESDGKKSLHSCASLLGSSSTASPCAPEPFPSRRVRLWRASILPNLSTSLCTHPSCFRLPELRPFLAAGESRAARGLVGREFQAHIQDLSRMDDLAKIARPHALAAARLR